MALGDSYAAGINADPDGELPICNSTNASLYGLGANCITELCGRNTGAYGYQFYQAHQPRDFTFLACSGDDTEQCANLQVDKIPSNADLVTINIGGNNCDAFSRVVTRCIYIPGQFGCAGALTNANDTVVGIDSALKTLFSKVKTAAPYATIVVLGYVQLWPVMSKKCQSPSLSRPSAVQKATMNSLVLDMNQKLAKAANTYNFTYVDADSLFEDHRLCDLKDPYIQWSLKNRPGVGDVIGDGDEDGVDDARRELFNHGVFHPFKIGHCQYRTALEKALGCEVSQCLNFTAAKVL